MLDSAEISQQRCPMCGAGLLAESEFCDECGERVGVRVGNRVEREKTALEKKYEHNLSVLEGLLVSLGHLTWVASIVMLLVPQMPAFGTFAFVAGSAWITAGYACVYQKHWGILVGLIVSYLTLGVCLLYWNLFGIFGSLILSIQAHRVLRLSHELSAESLETVEEA